MDSRSLFTGLHRMEGRRRAAKLLIEMHRNLSNSDTIRGLSTSDMIDEYFKKIHGWGLSTSRVQFVIYLELKYTKPPAVSPFPPTTLHPTCGMPQFMDEVAFSMDGVTIHGSLNPPADPMTRPMVKKPRVGVSQIHSWRAGGEAR